jgi:hypothetical protein
MVVGNLGIEELSPNTHLQTWRSLQPTWCVLGGTNLNPDPLSPQSGLLPSRLTPREAKGVDPIKLCEGLLNVLGVN